MLRESPLATIAEMAIKLGLSTRAIEKQLVKLKDSGQVKRIGPDRSGRWEVKEEATDHVPTPVPTEVVVDEASVKTSGTTTQETSVKTSVKIIEILGQNPGLTLADVAGEIGITLRAVEMASSKLVKEGRLKYIGPQKGGHWQITNSAPP